MAISFPFPPSSGQRYDYLTQSWIYNGTYWASVGASGNVTSGQLGTPVVFSGNIASGQIASSHLASGILTTPNIRSGDIKSGMVGDGAVFNFNIASGQIFNNNIASGVVTFSNLGSGCVTSGKIASGQVGEYHLGSGCVRSSAIASGQVGGIHLASGVFTSGILASGTISWVHIASGGLLSGNIASGQITAAHIGSGQIGSGNIGSGQIDTVHLNENATALNAYRLLTSVYNAGELISGIKAVCMGSGGVILRAERASGLRLPAIGVTMSGALSGNACAVVSYGRIFNSASGMVASGFEGNLIYVGSGGHLVNLSGFMGGSASGAPFLSGNMMQSIGVSVSGGVFVMPNFSVSRSGFQNTLPYDV